MDYILNGNLVEILPEKKTEETQLIEYMKRFQKEKEETSDAE